MAPLAALVRVLCLGLGLLCSSTGKSTDGLELVNNIIDNDVDHQPIYNRVGGNNVISNQREDAPANSNTTLSFSVSIATNKAIHTVDRRYLSTGFSAKQVAFTPPHGAFDPNSVLLQTLMRGLSPAVLRVGGRAGDEVLFMVNGSTNAVPNPSFDVDHLITGEQWKGLNEFTRTCGVDLAFTLNLAVRKGDSWDPTNAKELLDFNADHGYRVIWQLGNEPALFKKNYLMTIPARQLAKDFITLRGILSEDRYKYSNELVGPDMTHLPIPKCIKTDMPDFSSTGTTYLQRFLRDAGDAINATTLHFYNLNGASSNSIHNFTDPDQLIRTRCELQKFRKLMNDSRPTGFRVKWLGETSFVGDGGLQNVSDRYVAGFPILHNLGLAAEMKISVFIYWNLLNGPYGLLASHHKTYIPNPLYWAFLLHKRLLGTHVLSVSYALDGHTGEDTVAEKKKSYVHIFAHCTLVSPLYPAGAVTMMVSNLHNDSEASLHLTGDLVNKNVYEYLLTPPGGDLTSRNTTLNGHLLKMKNSTHFPDMIPRPLPVGSPIVLPPTTYGFYVIKNANAPACRQN